MRDREIITSKKTSIKAGNPVSVSQFSLTDEDQSMTVLPFLDWMAVFYSALACEKVALRPMDNPGSSIAGAVGFASS